jgi:hypothetical protein
MVITMLLAAAAFLPFNAVLPYPGTQEGKGAAAASFGCVTAGTSPLDASGNTQILYAAFDEAGGLLWADSVYLGQSSEIIAIQSFNGGAVLTGSSTHPSTTEDALAIAFSHDFELLFAYTLDLPYQERFTAAAQGADGSIVCAGSTVSLGAGGNDVLMVALDENGERLWMKTYGTPGEEAVYHISPCSDGGYVMACQAMDWGAGNGDYWIMRTDSEGDTLWTGTYGGPEFEYPWRVLESGEHYYVAGSTLSFGEGSYDWWVLKLDSAGNIVWDRTWGYKGTDTCMALALTDWGLVAGGFSEPVQGQIVATMVGFDHDGNVTSEWFYQPGIIRSIVNTGDGGFLVGGSVFGSDEDLWAMWVDSTGYAPELGTGPTDSHGGILLHSNPVSSSIAVSLPSGITSLEVTDMAGRVVARQNGCCSMVLDVSDLPVGVYVLSADGESPVRFAVIR